MNNGIGSPGPLPQWRIIGGYGSGTFEAMDPSGTTWRLWHVKQPAHDDPHPAGYRLAPRDAPDNPEFVSDARGLYGATGMAGMRIAADAIRADPEGARRQLGLDADRPGHERGRRL